MKYMLHIALLASTLAAHHSAQTAVKTQTVPRTIGRTGSRVMARKVLRSSTRTVALSNEMGQELDALGSQDDVPVNVEKLELAQRRTRAMGIDLEADTVVSDRIITRSLSRACRDAERRKRMQRERNYVRALSKKAAKSKVSA